LGVRVWDAFRVEGDVGYLIEISGLGLVRVWDSELRLQNSRPNPKSLV